MPNDWCGTIPEWCDICEESLEKGFVDGKTTRGPWANMCLACHAKYGIGLGTGKGQQYDGSGLKIDG